jgi:hypothetical protein
MNASKVKELPRLDRRLCTYICGPYNNPIATATSPARIKNAVLTHAKDADTFRAVIIWFVLLPSTRFSWPPVGSQRESSMDDIAGTEVAESLGDIGELVTGVSAG